MIEMPWMKFYPRDWRGDQALRSVSIAARGLWMECLCIMHEATPYGHLVLNGKSVEDDTLARMVGASVDEVSALMAELRKAGVPSMTREGVTVSRRMTMDHARAQKGRKAASKRWSQVSDGVKQSDAPNRVPNRDPNRDPITQKPEARSQKERKKEKKDRSADAPKNFVFSGNIIRLTESGMAKWREAFHAVPDIVAELRLADIYYSENPPPDGKWFFPVSQWLKRAHDGEIKKTVMGERPVLDENGKPVDPDWWRKDPIYRGAL